MKKDNAIKVNSDFTENYNDWKRWGGDNFAALTRKNDLYYRKLINFVDLNISKPLRVLEIGYGNGSFLKFCEVNKLDITGVEVNESLLDIARAKSFNVIHASNFCRLKPKSYDLIVIIDVLEHLNKDEIIGYLHSVNLCLDDGGTLIARFPNGDSPLSLPYQNGDITHKNFIGSLQCEYFINMLNVSKVYVGGDINVWDFSNIISVARLLLSI